MDASAKLFLRKNGTDQDAQSAGGGAGADLIVGAAGDDRLRGEDGDDILIGLGGGDLLDGGAGDDWMIGGPGGNTLAGGDGEDTVTWASVLKRDVWTRAVGVVVNLSGETLTLGNDNPGGRMTLFDLAGDVVGTAGRMLNNKNPELMRIADGEAGTLGPDATGGPLASIDTLSGIERFEGSGSRHDIAVLDTGFALVGTDAEGWSAYSDGSTTQWLRGFEHVFFA